MNPNSQSSGPVVGTPAASSADAAFREEIRAWLAADRPATDEERRTVLRAPYRIAGIHAFLWGSGAIVFGIVNATFSGELGQRVATTLALGGLTTCAVAYLVSERGLRPAAARALAEGTTDRPVAPGVRARALLSWLLGTAIPLVGVILIASSTLVEGDFSADELAQLDLHPAFRAALLRLELLSA